MDGSTKRGVTKGFLLLGFHIRHTAFTSPSIHDIMFNLIILYDKHVPDAVVFENIESLYLP